MIHRRKAKREWVEGSKKVSNGTEVRAGGKD